MKNIIANIVRGKSLTYLAAAFAALATGSAWASIAWIGEGADEYFDTANNKTGGPAGRGMYFADGVIPYESSEPLQVSNWTVRFNSYTKIGGASIYVGRACLTDTDKIWTVIADNDDCGFYLDSAYNLEVGWNASYGDGYFRIMNGKYSVNNVYIGPNASDPTTKGVLSIGSAGHTSTLTVAGNIEIRNGDLTTTNTAVTCGTLTAANKNNSSATIDKTGGDWLVNGDLKMNVASGTTAVFYNRGGNLVVTNNLVVQNTGFGEFYMEGGHVTVSNIVRFADNYLSSGNKANLYLNDGVFEAKAFRFHNCDNSTGNVIFNGGTYKALADGDIAVHEGHMGYGYLRFKVGAQGGTIDTAGHDVISPFQLLQDGSSTGGLVVKGGGSLTLSSNTITYNSKTFLEAGTLLAVSNNTAAANILANGIELIGTPALNTDYTVFVCNKELTESDLDNVNCATAEITKSLGADGKSIVVRCTAAKIFEPRYIGPANGSLSDGANWSPAGVPTSGNAYIPTETAANLTVGDTFSPSAITFLPGSAAVTIGGNALANIDAITNLSLGVQTFANSVTFKDAYRVYCDGYAVNFAGGATATCPAGDMVDNAASHMLMGNITFTNDWNCDYTLSNPYSVPNGSSLYGTSLTGTRTQIVLSVDVGGYAEFADNVYTGPNCGRVHVYGEMVVKGRWIMKGTGASAHVGFDGDAAGNGIVRANGIWKGDESNNMNRNCYIKPPYIYIGSDGLGAKSSDYAIHFNEGAHTVYATDDFEIFGNARTGYLWDWGLSLDNPTTFNTQGYTINWTAGANGSGAFIKDGEGTLIFNPYGTGLSGAVTVKGGTLKVMSASGVSTGAITNKVGGTLEVASGATLGSSAVTLEAGSTLALTATSSSFTALDNAVTLPTEGVATIRIDGARLPTGNHTILSGVAAGATDNVTLDMTSAALDGRKRASLAVNGGNLVLTIEPSALIILVR